MASTTILRAIALPRNFKTAASGPSFSLNAFWKASAPRISALGRSFSITRDLREKYYAESHEWVELSSDKKIGTVGVSAHAASALGDVVYVELPQPGQEVEAGDSFGAVESVKSASELYAPVGGEIIESNSALEGKPGTINQSPEAEGWITRIQLKDGEVERVEGKLMKADDYKKFTE